MNGCMGGQTGFIDDLTIKQANKSTCHPLKQEYHYCKYYRPQHKHIKLLIVYCISQKKHIYIYISTYITITLFITRYYVTNKFVLTLSNPIVLQPSSKCQTSNCVECKSSVEPNG